MRKFLLLLIPCAAFSQQVAKADFKTIDADISVDFATRKVSGHCSYTFNVLSAIDTIKIDAVNMTFANVKINNKSVDTKTTAADLQLFKGYKKGKNTLVFDYNASPKQTMYFVGDSLHPQIWTQGQGKNTSHWLPSFNDMNEKAVFSFTISYDKDFTVIANGVLKSKKSIGNKLSWRYEMKNPMSSYLAMIAIGKFGKRTETANSGIPLEQYYSLGDEDKIEPTYRNSKKIFDFLESEIGVPYPWEIYKQVPVRDFLYAGMENTSATVFSQDYVVDDTGYNDRDYTNVNAHELAHQWFGDLVTAKSGKHHWLQEGFATYYALLAERAVFGDDYFNNRLYEMAEELARAAKTDTIPILDEKASSLTFYKKGAWALHVLRSAIGEEKFRLAVKNYLKKYEFENVNTDEFLAEIKKVSDYDVDDFRRRWLENPDFEVREAIALVTKNKAIQSLFDAGGLRFVDATDAETLEKKRLGIIESDVFYPAKEEIIYQTSDLPFEKKQALVKAALESNNLSVRQAVARTIGDFPESFYADYATLLDDKSYLTQEIAMATLWKQFPGKHKELLDHMQGRIGFNDLNLRIQWLTLALNEKDYHPGEKVNYYDELIKYATPEYESSIRQNALENLIFIGPNDKNAMKLLVNPLVHHKWQFSKFAREKIRELIKYIAPRKFYEKLLPELPENERAQLKRLLDEKQ